MSAMPASYWEVTDDAPPETSVLEDKVQDWLSQKGLGETNPFVLLDAGADPDLSKYLVKHGVFRAIWQDSPSAIFAPAGGGKSAFRVRLTYACRVEEDERRVFPIPYAAPEPTTTSLDAHFEAILRNAAQELLLSLVYRPARFEALNEDERQSVRRVLDQNAPGLLRHYLPQVERAGGLMPLVEAFDSSAARLPARPSPYKVRALCTALGQIPTVRDVPPAAQRFQDLVDLLLGVLGFEAIYLLVDGVDAFLETTSKLAGIAVLKPLLEQMPSWEIRRVFLKLFLPWELRGALRKQLTKSAKVAIIDWTPESLIEVLHARLRATSRGKFDSLDAISEPSLRDAEAEILKTIHPIPRELLVLVNRIIVEHIRRTDSSGGLEPQDVKAAQAWYRRNRLATDSP